MDYISAYVTDVGRDSLAGTATRYRLYGLGIESSRGRGFPHPSRPAMWLTQLPVQWVPGLLELKLPRRGVDHQSPSSVEVKERVKPYFYSSSGPSKFVIG
jgi:hypothetical protein